MTAHPERTVVIVATLDTKGEEAAYLRDQVAAWGLETILVDPGILGQALVPADVSRYEVAQAAGTTLEALLERGEKSYAIARQIEGLIAIVQGLLDQGRLHGIVSIGGGQGTSIGTAAMRALPVGVPKLMLSTVASGNFQFGPYVGTKDICMMHSITDVLGLNAISRPILRNAANAVAGMALRLEPEGRSTRPAVAITMLGITTPCVMAIKGKLEGLGYDVVPFHANGTSGPAMEQLIEQGEFVGLIDLSTHEVIDQQHGGLAGAPDRMEVLTRVAVPAVVSAGGSDYLLFESVDKAPARYRDRAKVVHNKQMTCFAPTPDEMVAAAREMIERLNRALGPLVVLLSARGFSMQNREGSPLFVPEGNAAVIDEFRTALRPEIPVVVADLHINDPQFAAMVADALEGLCRGEAPQAVAARWQAAGPGQGGEHLPASGNRG
jgi:uncharacterized protein (UPF0261 family)